ncbi:MBL fold metallo-hydrolase [Roseinatronobacter sp. S2]|uniref:MBL fold metallo-hydrolase n=1 Tax=Roseinatronobacter sp. S2 TaxID=3035471 RepID=UPI00240EB62E|nr:MBL fold metallo-hydrolase [Roseinatronobacter sp. S2]WFE74220.1 MBL fold metallo-hydrolase [Roseinatronobacter sp. S2]
MAELRATILGCGSSGGVPRLGGHWGDCDPVNPRNTRRRCSLLLERINDAGGRTQVLIDTSPDMRAQLLDAGIGRLDAVVFTHAHADHVHGIDDLRQLVFNTGQRLAVWADGATQDALYSRFGYAFTQPVGSPYPPILDMHTIDGAITIDGAGGALVLHPMRLNHGSIDALGFRAGGLAYTPDVVEIYAESWTLLQGLDIWIVDALRRKPHPTHAHLDMTLGWITRATPKQAVLTNMHIDLDYASVDTETPENVTPAYDGMVLRLDI